MLNIGTLVDGKYKVLNKIGQGGMSVVYLAMNEKANKQWAIKDVRKDGGENADIVKQGIIVEMDLLKKLNHPNLPSIIDVIDDKDSFLIVMDYIQGNPLSKTLEESGAQPQEVVIEWAKQICDVLGYLHSRTPSIVYRDMKPSNVMLKPDGNIMLIDFGTAREYKEKNIADTTCLGTIGYAAPEQFGGQGQTDARTDIYCFGATLYHLVTGYNPSEPPYEIKPIRDIDPSLSGGLEKIILKCTQRDPMDRYQSCEELMYALEHYDEIDDIYRRKQKRRFGLFLTVATLSIISGMLSIYSYVSAEQKKSENYDFRMTLARDNQKSQEQRIEEYKKAIEVSPSDKRAYLEIIDLYSRSESESGNFSKEEANFLTNLQIGIPVVEAGGYIRTIYPLDDLKRENPVGYEEVCFEIGMLYWYDYEIISERSILALPWFRQAVNEYPIASLYNEIGEIQQQIKKYAGQNRTEKVYEVYGELWLKLVELTSQSEKSEDNDVKLLMWTELVEVLSDKAVYFSVNIEQSELLTVFKSIEKGLEQLEKQTKYDDIKTKISELSKRMEEAKVRIASIYQ